MDHEAPIAVKEEDPNWKKNFQRKYSQTRQAGFNVCTAGTSQLALGASGEVYGCPRYVGAKQYALGSIRDRTLLDIWNSPGWDWLREDYRPKLRLCNDCKFVNNCFYGKTCRANPGYLFNDGYGVSPECIREYDKLELPYEKVVAYLEERMESEADDLRVVALCERLLAEVKAKEESRHAAEETR